MNENELSQLLSDAFGSKAAAAVPEHRTPPPLALPESPVALHSRHRVRFIAPLLAAAAVVAVATTGSLLVTHQGAPKPTPTNPATEVPSPTSTPTASPTVTSTGTPKVTVTTTVRRTDPKARPPLIEPVPTSAVVTTSSTAPAQVRAFGMASASFVSAQIGYALGTAECASGPCTALLRTSDGGASWSAATAPTTASGAVDKVAFATADVGYAYSGSRGFVTTDGGRTWRPTASGATTMLPGTFTMLRLVGGRLEIASTGTDGWAGAIPGNPQVATSTNFESLRGPMVGRGGADGSRAYLVGGPGRSLWASLDGGRTWADRGNPCTRVDQPIDELAVGADGSVSVYCYANGAVQAPALLTSTDGGRTFPVTPAQVLQGAGNWYSASASVQFIGTNGLWRYTDRATKASQVLSAEPTLVRFTTAADGYAVAQGLLYVTTDGGTNWRLSRFG